MILKARAYDIREGIMSYESDFRLDDGYRLATYHQVKGFLFPIKGYPVNLKVTLQEAIDSDNYVVSYWTGKKDLEGTYIYDRDIFKLHGVYHYVVQWCPLIAGYRLYRNANDVLHLHIHVMNGKVIGNVDQNEVPDDVCNSWTDISDMEEAK